MSEQAVHDWIRKAVANNDVVVFMKGTKNFPQCGFSAQVAQILGHLGVSCAIAVREGDEPGSTVLAVSGEGSGLVIGRHGQTLDALEYMVNRLIGRDGESGGGRIIVDVESYRDRRREALEQMAKRLAEKVKATGKVVSLSPMSPRDRRIVHLALQEDPAVTTRSHGDGQYRKVLLIPATGGGHRPAR